MYERHFGFAENPFEVAPDPRFLFLNPMYQELLAALIYGVTERKGLIALVGEVGTGKTLMINSMKARLSSNVAVATIVNPDLTFRQMVNMILADLKLDNGSKSVSTEAALNRLRRFSEERLAGSGNVLVVIDEAQNLRTKTMENLRMLSNLETSQTKLVQMVFSGQPELDRKLEKPQWRQLVQRICIKRRSAQLSEPECARYIQHRLTVAGHAGTGLFSDSALKLVARFSEGIPRKINILCDNALLIAYGMGVRFVDDRIVREALGDLDWQRPAAGGPPSVPSAAVERPREQPMPREGRPAGVINSRKLQVPPIVAVLLGFFLLIALTLWAWEVLYGPP